MKKCTQCGKQHSSETVKFCADCGGKLEQELEEILPKKTVRGLKRNSIVYIAILAIAVIAISTLAGLTVKANNSIREQRDIVSGLNIDLQKKGNELTALQDTLSTTEEGRKQLEQAKSQVEAENVQLDTRATSAEQTASKAKSDLAKTQSDLNAKQAELSKINNDLSSKQAELAKATRGLALFDQAEVIFGDFYQCAVDLLNANSEAWKVVASGGSQSDLNYWNGIATTAAAKGDGLKNQMNALISKIRAGNY